MKPYYEHAGVTIYHGDCLEVLPSMPTRSFDHVITDPPYEAEAHTKARRQRSNGVVGVLTIGFDAMSSEVRAAVGHEFCRLSRGWVLVFCQVEAAMLWREAMPSAKYIRTQVWVKPDSAPQFTGDRPAMGYESIVTSWAGGCRPSWNGGGRRGVYEHLVGVNGGGRNPHPTMKPEPLMAELVALFTKGGETILDPFMGSGTTLVSAKRLGRKAIGIELKDSYFKQAKINLSLAKSRTFDDMTSHQTSLLEHSTALEEA